VKKIGNQTDSSSPDQVSPLVAGFQINSFIDYPGKIAAVLFLGGCNLRCYYCHNHGILSGESNVQPLDEILPKLREQVGFIDGVVITGGEPTLHPNVVYIITEIKRMGFLVKLDTNGTNSDLLMELVAEGMVDYVAMDVKAPLSRYHEVVGHGIDLGEVSRSIDFLIAQSKVEYMFRTTLAPILTKEDFVELAQLVKGAKTFQLQQFVPNDFSNSHPIIGLPYSEKAATELANSIKPHVGEILIRGF